MRKPARKTKSWRVERSLSGRTLHLRNPPFRHPTNRSPWLRTSSRMPRKAGPNPASSPPRPDRRRLIGRLFIDPPRPRPPLPPPLGLPLNPPASLPTADGHVCSPAPPLPVPPSGSFCPLSPLWKFSIGAVWAGSIAPPAQDPSGGGTGFARATSHGSMKQEATGH